MSSIKFVLIFAWLCRVRAQTKVQLGMQNFTGHTYDYRIRVFTGLHIIDSYDYPVETHTVVTRDGYILDIFRIPSSQKCKWRGIKPVVFLQHGLTCSADTFLMTGPKTGLPFMLVDICYDVWLSNCRGIRYSRRHTRLKSSEEEYWGFSWHEMGTEDLPAQIDYILTYTQQSGLHFVGHSQGCTTLMVLLSMRPEYNEKIKTATLLAPAVFMQNSQSQMINQFEGIIMSMKDCDFFGHNNVMRFLITIICKLAKMKRFCTTLYMMSSAKPSRYMNETIIPIVLSTHPAAISSRQPKHFLQVRRAGKFQLYDFGAEQNMKIYNQSLPPEYPLQNVRPLSPIHIFYSDGDTMTVAKDVLQLINTLASVVPHRIQYPLWAHSDFIFAKSVDTVVNQPIIEIIGEFERSWRENNKNPK
ncbi:lipase 1 [Drosophila takahashii]|uniref:lipase 1 n=1 Tax=Drosophila takahashii TaxID=29030 RepID=UPI0038996BAB